MELLYNTTKNKYNPTADIRLQFGQSLFTLGANNIGDGSRLELTYGKYVADNFSVRGGLFDGDVGIGVDYGLGGPFTVSAAVMDLMMCVTEFEVKFDCLMMYMQLLNSFVRLAKRMVVISTVFDMSFNFGR